MSTEQTEENINGVMVFEILPDGCLNGVYCNDHSASQNKVFNTIARKRTNDEGIPGEYSCVFIGHKNNVWNGEGKLTIVDMKRRSRNGTPKGQYDLGWFGFDGKQLFEGTGWLTRNNQLTVSYRSCK